jgi:hypothetical protein
LRAPVCMRESTSNSNPHGLRWSRRGEAVWRGRLRWGARASRVCGLYRRGTHNFLARGCLWALLACVAAILGGASCTCTFISCDRAWSAPNLPQRCTWSHCTVPLRSPDMKTCTTILGVTASTLVVHATSSHVFGGGLRRTCHSVLHGRTCAFLSHTHVTPLCFGVLERYTTRRSPALSLAAPSAFKLTVGSPCLQVYTCRRPAHPCLRAPQLSSTGAVTS